MKTNEDTMKSLNWALDEKKFFDKKEKERLRRVTKLRRDVALRWSKKIPVREWLIVDNATNKQGLQKSGLS